MSLRKTLLRLVALVVIVAVAWPIFLWAVARVEVEPDTFLVVTNRWGKTLPAGSIVAPDASFKGIQRRVLSEGRHFLNPLFYSWEIQKIVKVPEKTCAVLIRKAGLQVSSERKSRGEFLALGAIDLEAKSPPGERGIVEQVLGPGKYRINPYEYDHEIVPAIEIQSQQVGVKVLRWGEQPKQQVSPYVVAANERGVQKAIVPSGTHYINPYVAEVIPVDVRSHTVIFEDIEFPSKDGFTIEPRVEVRYKVIPEKAPELFVMLCEDGVLHQADQTHEDQIKNPILQKIVLPLIRGYVRIEGSKHDAREYISKPREEEVADGVKPSNPRERLQQELMAKVKPECEKVGVDLEYVAVGQTKMSPLLEQLGLQIRLREQARITRKTNEQKVVQYQQEQELKSTEALMEQRQLVIDANTKLERSKIAAERRSETEKLKLEADLAAAQSRRDGAKQRAEAILTKGKAEANVTMAENEAAVAELETAVKGFPTPDHFAQYHVLTKVSAALAEIFASDNSDFAKLFSNYMSPVVLKNKPALANPEVKPAVTAQSETE